MAQENVKADNSIIFHIDVNSAFLSWSAVKRLQEGETVDLREIPSIVGGDVASRHGIVTAKSIPAKKYGIETAEPVVSALRKCPSLVVIPGDREFYGQMSRAMMDYLRTYTPDIEQLSIDECFLDFGPISANFESPVAAATEMKDNIHSMFGFTVNVGISTNKLLAKMASDFQKPDRVHTLFPWEIQEKMWPLSVDDLYMVGKSSASRLKELGIRTIGDLANADPAFLVSHFKSHGLSMWEHANGRGDTVIHTEHSEAKGVGNSTTLPKDALSLEDAKPYLRKLADQVAFRLRKNQKLASTITLEIKYNDFTSCSKQDSAFTATSNGEDIYQKAIELFHMLWNGNPIRLLGIRGTKLIGEEEPVQLSIFDMTSNMADYVSTDEKVEEKTVEKTGYPVYGEKKKQLDKALDEIRMKYGKNAVQRGSFLAENEKK